MAILTKPTVDTGNKTPTDYEGWFCIQGELDWCGECGEYHKFQLDWYSKCIIVWEEKDDEYLLQRCIYLKEAGKNPKVVEYKPNFGKCVDFYKTKTYRDIK